MTATPQPAHPCCPACGASQQRLAALEAEVQRLRAAFARQVVGTSPPTLHAFHPARPDGAHALAGPHRPRRQRPSTLEPAPHSDLSTVPQTRAEQAAPAAHPTAPPTSQAESPPTSQAGPPQSTAPPPETCNGVIDGVAFTRLSRIRDARGWLMELFRQDELAASHHPQMGYISETRPGVVRGPHEHVEQTDLFVFAGPGEFRLYLWDARPGSATYGRYLAVELGERRPCAVLVPPGVVHAYKNIGSRPGWVFNLPNRLYRGEGRRQAADEIRHENRPDSPYRVA